jgi:transposase InsO family protein
MRTESLMGVHKRRWRRRRPDIAPAPDRLNRDFTAGRPNQRWVADITEFPTGEGKLHLAGVWDLCHRGLVGWSMGPRPDADLVVDALVMALGRAEPDADGLVHHSDKGGAYVSGDFCSLADVAGLQVSFGSTGDCWDCEHHGALLRSA